MPLTEVKAKPAPNTRLQRTPSAPLSRKTLDDSMPPLLSDD
jgi:hypothetical protein